MAESIFLKKQGTTPKNRILDFLIVHQEFDYSLKDIARFSKVGYTTLKNLKKDLTKYGWLIQTRKVGKANMYKLNLKSDMVKKFIDFYWSVIDSGMTSKKRDYSSSKSREPISA